MSARNHNNKNHNNKLKSQVEEIIKKDKLVELKKMLESNSKIYNFKLGEKESPLLLFSVRCQSQKVFKYLLDNPKVSINGKDKEGTSALINACIKNNVPMVRMLVSKPKIRVNSRTMYGKTGLLNAAQKGYTEVVNLLLEHGANVMLKETSRTKKSCRNRSAFNVSRICGHQNIYQKLSNKKKSNSLKKK